MGENYEMEFMTEEELMLYLDIMEGIDYLRSRYVDIH